MISIQLPDGSKRPFEGPVSVGQVAASIGAGLAKAALGGKVNGKLVDLSHVIEADAQLAIVTEKDADGLELIRHSTAHLLAYAVKELFPEAQVTIGPVIENGFYYDFAYKRPFTPEDLAAIEAKMTELAKKDEKVERRVLPRDQAIEHFKALGEAYKAELIGAIPPGEDVSLYREGAFEDLCRGPHVPSTGKLKHFKLMKVAGAYWRGDHRNEMLQRVYGTAWASKDDLQAYLTRLEEAEKRDHRRLGRELDLFHLDEHSPGTVFWHPKGWTLWQEVEQYMRRVYRDNGYQEVKGPQIVDRVLWEKSGHWEKYRDAMFTTESEKREYALKPMNCPGHILIFKQGVKSYRDLPLRYGEFGQCHRNEPTGGLHGIMRVRAFTQDDAHIFCSEEQIESETIRFCKLLDEVYRDLGFTDYFVKFSDRPPVRAGSDAVWDQAEGALKSASKAAGLDLVMNPGEGAFYGPKLEFVLRDAIGRDWQCGTLQVDFVLPERLDATYVAEDGSRKRPVMLHRAIFGSFERMIGILVENYAGRFPLWLAPTQAVVVTIVNDADGYANEVADALRAAGMRVDTDLSNEKINYKVREHSLAHVPLIIAVGRRDMEARTVAVRRLGSEKQEVLELGAAVTTLSNEARPPF